MAKQDDSCGSKSLQSGILHLRSLREKLCAQQKTWGIGFQVRDYVVDELQEMKQGLENDQDAPDWCLEKIEEMLNTLCVQATDDGGK